LNVMSSDEGGKPEPWKYHARFWQAKTERYG
jgi:hypothetical protein